MENESIILYSKKFRFSAYSSRIRKENVVFSKHLSAKTKYIAILHFVHFKCLKHSSQNCNIKIENENGPCTHKHKITKCVDY